MSDDINQAMLDAYSRLQAAKTIMPEPFATSLGYPTAMTGTGTTIGTSITSGPYTLPPGMPPSITLGKHVTKEDVRRDLADLGLVERVKLISEELDWLMSVPEDFLRVTDFALADELRDILMTSRRYRKAPEANGKRIKIDELDWDQEPAH